MDIIFQQAVTIHKEGKIEEAEKLYREILKTQPGNVDVNNNLGAALDQLGRLDEAEVSYKKAIELKPDYAETHNNLGNTLYKLGRFNEAEISCKKAIELKPSIAEAHCNLGNTLYKLSRFSEAETSCKKAIELKQNFTQAYFTLSNSLYQLGRFNEAEISYKKVIELKPNYAEAHNSLSATLLQLGNRYEAEVSCKKAIEINPDYAEAHCNLGNILFKLDRLNEAETRCKKAIELKPDYAEAYFSLGNVQNLLKKVDNSLVNYKSAYILKPDMDFILGTILHMKMHQCIWDDFTQDLNQLIEKTNKGEKVSQTFQLISLIDDSSLHRKSAEIYSNHKFPKSDFFPKISKYHGHKKIKIGYFSADFNNHPVPTLNAELYEIHDRKKFEIHAFSFGIDSKDEFNIRIKKGVDHFHDVKMMSDQDVVSLARSLEIDIAIDLGGFTAGSRQGVFSMSAAPIQVNYLGYPGTIAADYMDYLIADHIIIPKKKQNHYFEKIVYMPNSYQPNMSKKNILKISLSRQEVGLPDTGFVFCCFNNHYKITPTTFAGWMRILKVTNDSVLWLFVKNINAAKNLKKEAIKFGINEDRLIFAEHVSNEEHLKRTQLADLFLDTLPYNAHTTGSDALKMGLPLLTCIGNSFASRVAASILNAVNLPELITTTQDDYESLAIELASNPQKIKIIKDKLINNLTKAPLYDTPLYTRHLESAYSTMYKRYQDGLNPDHIEINH